MFVIVGTEEDLQTQPQSLWTVEQFATWANLGNRTAYRLVKALPDGVRVWIGKSVRIDPEALKKHMAENGGKL